MELVNIAFSSDEDILAMSFERRVTKLTSKIKLSFTNNLLFCPIFLTQFFSVAILSKLRYT